MARQLCCSFKRRSKCMKNVFALLVAFIMGFTFCFLEFQRFRRRECGATIFHHTQPQLKEGQVIKSCSFPNLDPFDPKIKKWIRTFPKLSCEKSIPNLVHAVDNELRIDAVKVKAKLKSIGSCRHRNISMKPGTDFQVVFGPWSSNFSSSIRHGEYDKNLQVECYRENKLVSRSYLSLVKKNKTIENMRLKDFNNHMKSNHPKETMNVLLVGIDGMSKQNFIRSMPKTKGFIEKELNAIEFHKYNKVGINTFPNVFPLLTGIHVEEAKNWTTKMPFDSIDHLFLWNRFQKSGYRTSVLLDGTHTTAFHYLKKGWSKPNFDFYPRPVTVAKEKDTFVHVKKMENCMGDTAEITYFHDYMLQLTTAYNNSPSTPYFIYSFLIRLTHDDQYRATSGDELYLKFFQDLKNRKLLNNTLLIFFSDHGARFGSIRNTYNGLIEAKTPLLFFMFPPWFEKKYPQLMKTFRINTKRLMTTFDIHATLKDVLYFTGKSRTHSPSDRGISLFSEIPDNRTCKAAGIPIKFCVCTRIFHGQRPPSNVTNILVKGFMEHVVLLTKKHRDKCELLKLKNATNVFPMDSEFKLTGESLYYITIETTPGNAIYEATMSYKTAKKMATVMGDVSRLNFYRGQAECIQDAKLRSFCFCSNLTFKTTKKKPMVNNATPKKPTIHKISTKKISNNKITVKPTVNKTLPNKPVINKTSTKKVSNNKTTVKPTVNKTLPKKPVIDKTPTKKVSNNKTTVKPTVNKTTPKKPVIDKTPTKKVIDNKTTVKPTVNKTTPKKPVIDKTPTKKVIDNKTTVNNINLKKTEKRK